MTTQDQGPGAVLVATDLSEPGDEAIRRGHEAALATNAELVVLHVIAHDPDIHPLFPQQLQRDATDLVALEGRVADAVSERVEQITGREPGAARVEVDFGEPYAEIVLNAEEIGAALVVVAGRGASGLPRQLLGSVAEKVVRHAHCPVLVARAPRGSGGIVVPTDFSDASLAAVEEAAREVKASGQRLTLHHDVSLVPGLLLGLGLLGDVPVVPPPETVEVVREAAVRTLKGMLERFGVTGDVVVTTEGNPATAVVRTADSLDAERIVISARGRTPIGRLALGSTAESVVRLAHCSVLVVRSA
jgi:nucleotide-binding universal stress UspA family protein